MTEIQTNPKASGGRKAKRTSGTVNGAVYLLNMDLPNSFMLPNNYSTAILRLIPAFMLSV